MHDSKKSKIVIVTNYQDMHVDRMIDKLNSLGYDPFRVNSNDVPFSLSMSFLYNENVLRQGGMTNSHNGKTIDFSEIRSIWWRRPESFPINSEEFPEEKRWMENEWRHAWDSAWSLVDCYWVSLPWNMRRAGLKLEQLQRAGQMGFRIPDTIITMKVEELREFYDAHNGEIVYKTLSAPWLLGGRVTIEPGKPPPRFLRTMTTVIEEEMFPKFGETQLVPCQFQQHIKKTAEFRVTIIGDDIFIAELDSQQTEDGKIDWRKSVFDMQYHKGELPVELQEKCLDFVKSYSLNYSTMDLILSTEGEYFFLENNPNGQFMFIEDYVPELKMTDALAGCLIRGSNAV